MPSRLRILLWSTLSGVLWALSWPAIGGITWLAFVAWLPLLHAERLHDARTADRQRAFVPYTLPALFIWNASCAWWFWCVSEPLGTKLISVGAPVIIGTLMMVVPWWLKRNVHRVYGAKVSMIALVFFWLSGECLRHSGDLQWPWFAIGNVFGTHPAWVQWYEVTGVLGGSLWVLLITWCVDRGIITWSSMRRRAMVHASIGALLFALPFLISQWRFGSYPVGLDRSVEVVVVQPNIDPYNAKFGGMDPLDQLEYMLTLAQGQMTDSTTLVLFPETALQEAATVDMRSGELLFNGLWENDLDISRSVQRFRRFQQLYPHAAVLCGMSSDRWFRGGELPSTARPLGDGQHWYEAYNAALWMPAKGAIVSYHKSKLVAGPELVPYEEVLGVLGDLSVDLGGTTGSLGQQEERSVLRDGSSGLAVAPVICYESVFGEHVAAHIRNGATLIAIMTNDGWWDDSPGYRQHLAFAPLRAIETRRDVVRSANTGISCMIDQRGVIHGSTTWWTPDARRYSVQQNTEITFFVQHGDLIGPISVFTACIFFVIALVRRIRQGGSV